MARQSMIRLGTHIPRESYYKLQELSDLFGSQSNALEKAIELLYEISKYSTKIGITIMRERLINEFDNILLARTNFIHLLKGEQEKVLEESYVSAILRSFYRKNIKDVNFNELLKLIKKVYIDGNKWFTNVDARENEKFIEVAFFHNLCIEFSNFASVYFSSFFENLGYSVVNIDKWQKMFIIKLKQN